MVCQTSHLLVVQAIHLCAHANDAGAQMMGGTENSFHNNFCNFSLLPMQYKTLGGHLKMVQENQS